jgi:hypothetical protein
LSQAEAAEMLGMCERMFRRWRDRLRDEGVIEEINRIFAGSRPMLNVGKM